MKQAQKLISSSILEELILLDCLKETSPEVITTAEKVIHKYLSRLGFTYDKDKDFAFINELITNLATMFFDEHITVHAASFFKNNRLGGFIKDEVISGCISNIATQILNTLSIDYKIRLSMYLKGTIHTEDENNNEVLTASAELDASIVTYIYFYVKPILVAKSKDYNSVLLKKNG